MEARVRGSCDPLFRSEPGRDKAGALRKAGRAHMDHRARRGGLALA